MEIELNRLIDALPGLVWTAFPDGRAEYIGKRWLEYTGLRADEAIGQGWQSAVHPNDAQRLLTTWDAIIASGALGEVEARLRRFDDVYHWFLFRACPMPDPSGKVARWCGINVDIEDRVQAEEAAREHQRHFQRLIDALPGLVWTTTPDGASDFINQRWREYAGLTLDQVRGRHGWRSAIHPDDLPHAQESWNSFLAAGAPGEVEARLRRFDGEYRRFDIKTCPLTDASGQIVGWCGINTDIEDRRRAEEALLAHERRFQFIIDGLPAIAPLFTPQGRIMFCNKQMLDYLDETLEQVLAQPRAYYVHPDERDEAQAAWLACVQSGEPFIRDGRLRRADGVYRWHRTRVFPLRNDAGEIELWYGLSIDIEDTKQAETELRRANSYLTEAQRLSKTGSFSSDVVADDHSWSDEVYSIFEFDPGTEVSFQRIQALLHPEDLSQFEDGFARAAAGASDFDGGFRILTPSGRLKHLHCVAHRMDQTEDRPVFVGAIQDVTEAKIAEEAVNRARADLAHVTRVTALSALTASIAHEVNQPLAGIITNAAACLRMLAADPPNLEGARATAQRTIRDGNRASEVIQRLRTLFARKPPSMGPVELNDAAGEVLALSSSELQRRRVVLRTDFAEDLPPVSGDRVQLQQVILNLILNAADAMSGVDDRPRDLWVATARDEMGKVTLSVRDAGAGIEAQNLERLFDTFYTTKAEGMGIGLSISRSIIQGHEGRLWASANDGPGVTFSFSIPYRLGSAPGPEDRGASAADAGPGAQHLSRKA
jgi:PAS domain S-box-containing protein